MPLMFYDLDCHAIVSVPPEELNGELERAPFIFLTEEIDPAVLAHHYAGTLCLEPIPFEEKTCFIAHRNLTFHRPPAPSSSSTSGAQYWIEHWLGPQMLMLILLQYLPPRTRTSAHWHHDVSEFFHCLLGRCMLTEGKPDPDGNGKRYARKSRRHRLQGCGPAREVRIGPGIAHQLETLDCPALNFIAIEGTTAQTMKELIHHHVTWENEKTLWPKPPR